MRLLLDLQPKWNWHLAIAHCNHRWRTDSDENAAYVARLATTWNLPYYEAIASTVPASEAAARTWRYTELGNLATNHQLTAIVTGHTASDRAETLLYNLMRGSGGDGLHALTWSRELVPGVTLVRPLMDVSREETAQFCQNAGLSIWNDTTNQDWRHARNRIRQELIPYLKEHFNPQVEQVLAQTAELLRADTSYLEAQAAEWRQQVVEPPASDRPSAATYVNRHRLQQAPLSLQRRVLRQVLQALMPETPRFDHVEKLVALMQAPNRTRTDPFPGGAIAHVDGVWIVLSATEPVTYQPLS